MQFFSRKQDQERMGIVVHMYKDSIWLLDSLPGIPEHWALKIKLFTFNWSLLQ
jgi:hypothetical protein